jgi:hypothetical protein
MSRYICILFFFFCRTRSAVRARKAACDSLYPVLSYPWYRCSTTGVWLLNCFEVQWVKSWWVPDTNWRWLIFQISHSVVPSAWYVRAVFSTWYLNYFWQLKTLFSAWIRNGMLTLPYTSVVHRTLRGSVVVIQASSLFLSRSHRGWLYNIQKNSECYTTWTQFLCSRGLCGVLSAQPFSPRFSSAYSAYSFFFALSSAHFYPLLRQRCHEPRNGNDIFPLKKKESPKTGRRRRTHFSVQGIFVNSNRRALFVYGRLRTDPALLCADANFDAFLSVQMPINFCKLTLGMLIWAQCIYLLPG